MADVKKNSAVQATTRSSSYGYVPELDGLRGCAILLVMFTHSTGYYMGGGTIGVVIFFVLSGFLITSLLLKEFENTAEINLKRFYVRRALRLLPALLFMLGVLLAISLVELEGARLRSAFKEVLIVLFYAANWVRAYGLFPTDTLGSLEHTWSLSIEEQFYILWPAFLIIFFRFTRSKQRLCLAILLMALVSWGERIVLAIGGTSNDRLYNGLDTRADALLVGCFLAVLLSQSVIERTRPLLAKPLRVMAPLAAMGLVLAALFLDAESSPCFYWGFVVVEILTAIIILDISISKQSWVRRFLSFELLIQVGVISYGLYLWHIPVYALFIHWGIAPAFGAVAASFLAAYLSYRFVERPFLKLKKKYST